MSNIRTSLSSPPAAAPPNSKRVKWIVVLLTIGLVVVPVAVRGLPKEIARWKLAAATEAHLDSDAARAETLLAEVLQTDPTDASTLLLRGRWRMEGPTKDRDYVGAAEDFTQVLKLHPREVNLSMLRATAFQHVQRHDEAIEDADTFVAAIENVASSSNESWMQDMLRFVGIEWSDRRTNFMAHARNARAYAKAVANRDLDAALKDANAAIEALKVVAPSELPSVLDTRGFIYYRLGDHQTALDDLNAAVATIESPLVDDWPQFARKSSRDSPDPRTVRMLLLKEKETIAVIRYHRMLVHEALGHTADADADRKRVVELGFEPNEQLF